MSPRILHLICLCLAWGPLAAEEGLVDPPEAPRSPEGNKELGELHSMLIKALGDERIERRFQAINKIRQLEHDELSRDLVSAIVESLEGENHNYLWFAAHTLKRISGRDLGINRESWRQWLREEYKAPEAAPPKADPSPEMGSGSQGHDNSGGVPALDVPSSDKLGHDPNAKVVEGKPGEDAPVPGESDQVPKYEPTPPAEDDKDTADKP